MIYVVVWFLINIVLVCCIGLIEENLFCTIPEDAEHYLPTWGRLLFYAAFLPGLLIIKVIKVAHKTIDFIKLKLV